MKVNLTNICKGYLDGTEFHSVLQGANLTLERGEQLALMGESGSGKSTLLNLISGLDSINSGEIWFDDTPFHLMTARERVLFRRQYIGMVFQQYNLLPTLTIADNIRFSRQLNGQPENMALWRQIISVLDIHALLGRYPEEVSGGQQQRVAIARTLYMEPAILLADEPTGSLDEKNAHAVMRLLSQLTKQLDCTLLLVTHSENVASYMEKCVRLQGGALNVKPHR
ncbi:ABC transporter ATP-binding protein [Vibrio sp. SS-MA-C1-2]|uniref:ABC transporter ATP-binding protein n=1 Tax=Vibrio sp. SS-MA-C1-2 TaxID=2908646 RepID=UPI001F24FDA1|nr:ABC transporter ATP-binding protein [Vibrio sp. SS-MA-C1-2]UJF20061.1 ABC transporter ATP-binding protein [Vibrio sp. SS-MA-C1-2]